MEQREIAEKATITFQDNGILDFKCSQSQIFTPLVQKKL